MTHVSTEKKEEAKRKARAQIVALPNDAVYEDREKIIETAITKDLGVGREEKEQFASLKEEFDKISVCPDW